MRAVFALLLSVGLSGAISRAVAAPATLTAADRAKVVHDVAAEIQKTYVFPELKAPLVAKLEAGLAGRYDTTDPDELAHRITEDLQAVSHDGHLYINADPEGYAAAREPPRSPKGTDALRRADAIRDHHGLARLDVLPGNVRYLKITAFQWVPRLTAQAYDDAMRFLRDGDAVILDLRENGGGNSDAADYLGAYVAVPRKASKGQAWPHVAIPQPPLTGKLIYVLVDGRVASAGEAVAYGMQQDKVGIVVGSATYGAANNNKKIPIAPAFILSVSFNRPIHPVSGTNWEGVGVQPDLPAPGNEALITAQLDALTRLGARPEATDKQKSEYRWAAVDLQARKHLPVIARSKLHGWAGHYGTIELRETDDGLRLYRADRPRWQPGSRLRPLSEDGLFAVELFENLRLRITPTGLDLLHGGDDQREPFARTAR